MGLRKYAGIALMTLLAFSVQAQVFFTRQGSIDFNGVVEGVEEVRARSTKASCVVDTGKKLIRVEVPVGSFDFPIALMEKHFNENYAESDTYPKASFKGSYEPVEGKANEIEVKGELTFHGRKRFVNEMAKLKTAAGAAVLEGSFELLPEDFDIELPKSLRKKVSEMIRVTVYFELRPYRP